MFGWWLASWLEQCNQLPKVTVEEKKEHEIVMNKNVSVDPEIDITY